MNKDTLNKGQKTSLQSVHFDVFSLLYYTYSIIYILPSEERTTKDKWLVPNVSIINVRRFHCISENVCIIK